MTGSAHLDDRLLRALKEGPGVLPEDPRQLVGYLRLIDRLLGERAAEHEPDWTQAIASAAEIETLQALEATVTERAITLRADTLEGVLLKLEIWRALDAGSQDGDASDGRASSRDRLVLSIEADLVRMARGRDS